MEGPSSTSTQYPDTVHKFGMNNFSLQHEYREHATDAEGFVPELVQHQHEDRSGDLYRFQCPRGGQFQCKNTDLVFEMKEKGEVLYRIVSWGIGQLDGVGQMQPAGPLYNIDCVAGSVCKLHLPHCEIDLDKNEPELSVAHFCDGNVEIIQPLKVTDTHVITEINSLSPFGLLKRKEKPIRAQVLLFYKELLGRTKRSKLHVHLLPRNVPVEELQKRDQHNTYIESSSTCDLTPGKTYRPRCKPYEHQPKTEKFDCDYGPNYHPTFEVWLGTEVEELTQGLLDEHNEEVWPSRLVFLTGNKREAISPKMAKTGAEFVDKHREKLIQKISSVMEIADCLLSKNMINGEMNSAVSAAAPPQGKMRSLYGFLDSGGKAVKEEFYQILREKHPHLVDDLESGSS